MSSNSPKDSERREIAATLVAGGKGRVLVTTAMKIAGYSTPESRMNTKQKRVSRRAKGVAKALEAVKAGTVVPGTITVEPEQSSGGTGRSSLTSSSTTSAAAATTTRTTTRTTRANDADDDADDNDVARRLLDKSPAMPVQKKRRRSSKQKQEDDAAKVRKQQVNKQAMKVATTRVDRNNKLPKGHRHKTTAVQIVEETNNMHGSGLDVTTVRRYVRQGDVGVSPKKMGPVGRFPVNIWKMLMADIICKQVQVTFNIFGFGLWHCFLTLCYLLRTRLVEKGSSDLTRK